jgi:inhibitor of KinA sporulation pathway (predicted exonuclease)
VARRLDQLIVIDVESTCWEGAPPPGQRSEIIEIGICLLCPQTGEYTRPQSILVRPEHSTVSEFCTRLTTLRPEDVAHGLRFSAACQLLEEQYQARSRTWASFGDYDRRQFLKQCMAEDVPYPFSPTHLNVKNLFALVAGIERELGLAQAFAHLGWTLEGTHHRGADDAGNIARLLAKILEWARASYARH